MRKWVVVAGAAWIVSGACIVREEDRGYGSCAESHRECQVAYSRFSGYYRSCSTVAAPCYEQGVASNQGDDDDDDAAESAEPSSPAPASSDAGSSPAPEPPPSNVGAAPLPDRTRYSAFDIPCERDSQCGPGKCVQGDCFYGCSSDAQCGSGDRCAVESGTRICRPDPNPPVECTRSAQCEGGFSCLNGSCRQVCTETEQCDNLLDRCASGICLPDRRPLGECVLNSECAGGFVCLDGACVAACPPDAEPGVCLAEPDDSQPGDAGATPAAPEQDGEDDDEAVSVDAGAPVSTLE